MAEAKPERSSRRRNDRGRPKGGGGGSQERESTRTTVESHPPRDLSERFKVGISMGDVHGIGPELLIEAFSDPRMFDLMIPIVYGSSKVLLHYKQLLKAERFSFVSTDKLEKPHGKKVNLVEAVKSYDTKIEPGVPSEAAGKLAWESLRCAVEDLKEGHIDTLVTLPIDKATIQNDEFRFPGHTEYLAEHFGKSTALMLMVHEDLRVAVLTGHIPLSAVSAQVTPEALRNRLQVLNQTMRVDFKLTKARIAVLGLNPHAGDGGLIGLEDKDIIQPTLEQLREQTSLLVYGPYPADGFFASDQYRRFDAVLAMYHDQGLIPFKTISNGWGVNYTAGLSVIRTSPDHGTAYDIAGLGRADVTSFRNALFAAIDIRRTRSENEDLYSNALDNMPIADFTSGEDEVVSLETEED